LSSSYSHFARGKLLLSGEYLVLDGAKALAFPTKLGQRITTKPAQNIQWISYDYQNEIWFWVNLSNSLKILDSSDNSKALYLVNILKKASQLSEKEISNTSITTKLDFPNNWGFGSSSTLVYLIAKWLEINPMDLFFACSKGSGYDIACAGESKPLIYQLRNIKPTWERVALPKVFESTWFIHLGEKQKSDLEVQRFSKLSVNSESINAISNISLAFLEAKTSTDLQKLMLQHEAIVSSIIGMETIQNSRFKDFNGSVKSLGAWGGDFIMALGEDVTGYFKQKGYDTILPFHQVIA
jgi:mevalonate kinase